MCVSLEKQVIEFAVCIESKMEFLRFWRNRVSCYGLNLTRAVKAGLKTEDRWIEMSFLRTLVAKTEN